MYCLLTLIVSKDGVDQTGVYQFDFHPRRANSLETLIASKDGVDQTGVYQFDFHSRRADSLETPIDVSDSRWSHGDKKCRQ